MARIVGGIGCSHAPSIAHSYDKGQQRDPMWAPLYEGFAPARDWLSQLRPDLMIVVYNDHMNRFFFDAYPSFALGVADTYPQADEGWGTRDLPDLAGDSRFAWHLARSLVEDEFDPAICQEMTVDHGIFSILPLLARTPWPAPIVPIAANVILHPIPTPRRFFRLGEAIRRAVAGYPADLRVLVMATGGMSHQLHGPRFGFTNPQWDNEFLDRIEHDPQSLTRLTHQDYMERGGAESVEVIMWLAMRAALGTSVRRVHRYYYAPMLTGYGLIVLEGTAG
ncbi:MAG TPA: class III extradiol dioxygenase family protein [Xanthobacteraceae bacterium]|jgi:protocatechuate 4,5-dioxygenase beta chain